MDATLAAPCRSIEPTTALDYDVWDDELVRMLLEVAADCARRHRLTVEAWEGLRR